MTFRNTTCSIYIIYFFYFFYICLAVCVFMLCGKNTPSQRLRVVCTCTSVCPDACTVHHSVNSHTQPKQWKPGKNVGWQGRQLVVLQIKLPVSRRNRELGRQLSGILKKSNKQIYVSTRTHTIHTSMLVCRYDCLRSESESASHSSPRQLKGVRVISACVCARVLTAVVHHKRGQTRPPQLNRISRVWVCTTWASVCVRLLFR